MWTAFELNQFSWYMWTQISKLAKFLRSNVLKHVYFWDEIIIWTTWCSSEKKLSYKKPGRVFECLCYWLHSSKLIQTCKTIKYSLIQVHVYIYLTTSMDLSDAYFQISIASFKKHHRFAWNKKICLSSDLVSG